jgi:hypothetical protein
MATRKVVKKGLAYFAGFVAALGAVYVIFEPDVRVTVFRTLMARRMHDRRDEDYTESVGY